MDMKNILRRFFAKYGEIGMRSASWHGSYEPKVPASLVQSFTVNSKTVKTAKNK